MCAGLCSGRSGLTLHQARCQNQAVTPAQPGKRSSIRRSDFSRQQTENPLPPTPVNRSSVGQNETTIRHPESQHICPVFLRSLGSPGRKISTTHTNRKSRPDFTVPWKRRCATYMVALNMHRGSRLSSRPSGSPDRRNIGAENLRSPSNHFRRKRTNKRNSNAPHRCPGLQARNEKSLDQDPGSSPGHPGGIATCKKTQRRNGARQSSGATPISCRTTASTRSSKWRPSSKVMRSRAVA